MNKYFLSNKKGFTLIEVVMIIVILGIIMPGIMLYFITGVKDSAIPQRRTTAIFLAEALMEEIKSKRWDETAGVITFNSTCSNASALSFDGAEARGTYDDIDDFNGLNNPTIIDSLGNDLSGNYPGFSQTVTVCYVPATSLNDTSACATRTCYKRIQVSITDTGTNETISLVNLMTSYD